MKTKDIAKKYDIDYSAFTKFLSDKNKVFTVGVTGVFVDDALVDEYVQEFNEWLSGAACQKNVAVAFAMQEQQRQQQQEELRARRKATAQMLISSGFSFEGYKIVKYSGYISGDDVTQIPRTGIFTGNHNGEHLTNALVKIRRQALAELKDAAYDLGCNAIIGVDFDYITLEPETATIGGGTLYEPYIICVTANGNAVVIEKEEEQQKEVL